MSEEERGGQSRWSGGQRGEGGRSHDTDNPSLFPFFQMFAVPENVHGTSWLAFQSRPLKI